MTIAKDGYPQNPSFVDYRIATTVDMPHEIIPLIVEVPQDDGPWGARSIGKHAMAPTAPAIANAVYNAVGVRLPNLPLTAEKVFLALQAKALVVLCLYSYSNRGGRHVKSH